MFRIVCDPSSGSTELCYTEIALSGSQIFFVCLVGVWQRNFEPVVCVHGTTGWKLAPSPSYCAQKLCICELGHVALLQLLFIQNVQLLFW